MLIGIIIGSYIAVQCCVSWFLRIRKITWEERSCQRVIERYAIRYECPTKYRDVYISRWFSYVRVRQVFSNYWVDKEFVDGTQDMDESKYSAGLLVKRVVIGCLALILFAGCAHTNRNGIDAIRHRQEAYRIYIETEVNAGRMTCEAGYIHLSNGMMATDSQLLAEKGRP